MKHWILLLLLCAGVALAHEEAAPPAPSGSRDSLGVTYGAPIPVQQRPTSIAAATAQGAAPMPGQHVFIGRITEVCQQQGCWMVLEDQGRFARVFMHDHSFSVPKDATGPAVVYGSLSEHKLAKEQVEHLRQEGSKTASDSEWRIDALSVRISGQAASGGG